MTNSKTRKRLLIVLLLICVAAFVLALFVIPAPPSSVPFSQSAQDLDAYDFVEITANVAAPHAPNPFTDASITGKFESASGDKRWTIEGFCDSPNGSVYRVRFMPSLPGEYRYSVQYRQGWSKRKASGVFRVRDGHRRGTLRIDPNDRWHFVWEGSGEHYFFNGTTAYWLIGWRDEQVIRESIDRLHRLDVNRMRVTIAGRTDRFFGEPVAAGPNWTPHLRPWARNRGMRFLHLVGRAGQRLHLPGHGMFDEFAELAMPDDIYHPAFDYSRFEVEYWQKFERALRFARDRDMVISVVLDMNDSKIHPATDSADEERFIRYAVARFAAFSNITWDLGDDLNLYRDDAWTHRTGTRLKQIDPYQHLATSHPTENEHQDRTSEWFDFTSFQEWSRNQHEFMLAQREQQKKLGRIIPQTNEEYGYEDHYPMWGPRPPGESADALRRMAWEIVTAGGYQTTGETARRGTNIWPDTGGGWMNGRGDETMTMLKGYSYMVEFLKSFDWWKTEPHDELVTKGNYCLAQAGQAYLVYLPKGGSVELHAQPGIYAGTWLNATTGTTQQVRRINVGSTWRSPEFEAANDWALLLKRVQ